MAAESAIQLYYHEDRGDWPHGCQVLRAFCAWAHRKGEHPCPNLACTLNEPCRARLPAPRADARPAEIDLEGAWKIVGKIRWEGKGDRAYDLDSAKMAVASCGDRRLGEAVRLLAAHLRSGHPSLAELDEGMLAQLIVMGKAFVSEAASSESLLEYAKNEAQDVDLLGLL